MELKFRTLRADEIKCRVQMVKENGCSLLLYKDSRVDMDILDETVGAMNWRKDYRRDNANCIVSIFDSEKGEWVSKEDTGTESNTEKAKGLASDSFKRACVNWGIGRELYTSPFIWISAENCDIKKSSGGKCTTFDHFSVTKIEYDDKRRIKYLVVRNDRLKKVVYSYGTITETSEDRMMMLEFIKNALSEHEIAYTLKSLKVQTLEAATTADLKMTKENIKLIKEKAEKWNPAETEKS